MLSRRQFHATLIAGLAAMVAKPVQASSGADDLWLNRLTFGATPQTRAELAAMGRDAWLAAQLAMDDDPALQRRLETARLHISYDAGEDENGGTWQATDEFRGLDLLNAPSDQLVQRIRWENPMHFAERARPAQEVVAASLIRAVHTPAQLREVITQFWHNHFNVNAQKDETTAALFPPYDRCIRSHALGNFRVLLGEVARAPAMLYYLNNADSIASPANENYARELLELHTLGAANYLNDRYDAWHEVPGAADGLALGYMDADVYEVARAFTGWSVGDGRIISDGEAAPLTGEFHFVTRWHDPYQKRVLGREFLPNQAPMADGDQVLDLLAHHPGTALFICTKLARRLLSDTPPTALVQRMADTFLAAVDQPDQIAQVLRVLVLSPEFGAPPEKIRQPFEFMTAFYRATGAEVCDRDNSFHWRLSRAGWQQHDYGPPTGHPDVIGAWTGASTLNRMVDLAVYGLEDWFAVASVRLDGADRAQTVASFLARWAGRMVPDGTSAAQAVIAEWDLNPTAMVAELVPEDRAAAARAVIAMAALTPDFVMR